jgi:hypothetical protein
MPKALLLQIEKTHRLLGAMLGFGCASL